MPETAKKQPIIVVLCQMIENNIRLVLIIIKRCKNNKEKKDRVF